VRIPFILLFWLTTLSATAQKINKENLTHMLRQHIAVLSHDSMQGRRTGTEGERKAADYIAAQFRHAGLAPKGENGYFSPFEIYEGKEILPATSLSIDGNILSTGHQFFPLPSSPDVELEALPSISLQEPGMQSPLRY
jgi:hypothetical protein